MSYVASDLGSYYKFWYALGVNRKINSHVAISRAKRTNFILLHKSNVYNNNINKPV